jgi:hypothetical protein
VHAHSSFRLLPLIGRRYSPARVGQERTLTTALTGIPQTKPRTCLSDRPFLNWLEAQMRGTADLIERQPRIPRSIEVLVDSKNLSELI